MLAVVGHNYSVFLRFNGGVGTMTSLGAGVALMFSGTLAAWGLGFALILVTRYASVGSLIIAAALPVACLIGALVGAWPYQYLAFALGAGALSIYAPVSYTHLNPEKEPNKKQKKLPREYSKME